VVYGEQELINLESEELDCVTIRKVVGREARRQKGREAERKGTLN